MDRIGIINNWNLSCVFQELEQGNMRIPRFQRSYVCESAKIVKLVLPVNSVDVVKDVVNNLSDRQHLILEMIRKDNTLSARAMSERLSGEGKVSERTVQRDLETMKKMGILSRIGGPFNGKWTINDLK